MSLWAMSVVEFSTVTFEGGRGRVTEIALSCPGDDIRTPHVCAALGAFGGRHLGFPWGLGLYLELRELAWIFNKVGNNRTGGNTLVAFLVGRGERYRKEHELSR